MRVDLTFDSFYLSFDRTQTLLIRLILCFDYNQIKKMSRFVLTLFSKTQILAWDKSFIPLHFMGYHIYPTQKLDIHLGGLGGYQVTSWDKYDIP